MLIVVPINCDRSIDLAAEAPLKVAQERASDDMREKRGAERRVLIVFIDGLRDVVPSAFTVSALIDCWLRRLGVNNK